MCRCDLNTAILKKSILYQRKYMKSHFFFIAVFLVCRYGLILQDYGINYEWCYCTLSNLLDGDHDQEIFPFADSEKEYDNTFFQQGAMRVVFSCWEETFFFLDIKSQNQYKSLTFYHIHCLLGMHTRIFFKTLPFMLRNNLMHVTETIT